MCWLRVPERRRSVMKVGEGLEARSFTEAHPISPVYHVAQWIKNLPAMQETQETRVRSLGWEDPLEEGWQPVPVFLPGESPWTEEPGRLQSIGSKRRISLSEWACTSTHAPDLSLSAEHEAAARGGLQGCVGGEAEQTGRSKGPGVWLINPLKRTVDGNKLYATLIFFFLLIIYFSFLYASKIFFF